MPTATPPRRAVMVSEGVAVAAAGSVLRGLLQIGRAMAAAVALVGLLGAELLVLPGARAIWSGFPRPARPGDRRRGADAAARSRPRSLPRSSTRSRSRCGRSGGNEKARAGTGRRRGPVRP